MLKKENKTRDGESAEEDAIGVNGEECDGDVDHF